MAIRSTLFFQTLNSDQLQLARDLAVADPGCTLADECGDEKLRPQGIGVVGGKKIDRRIRALPCYVVDGDDGERKRVEGIVTVAACLTALSQAQTATGVPLPVDGPDKPFNSALDAIKSGGDKAKVEDITRWIKENF